MTWANIAMLRSSGSTLPVEVWHLPGEITHAGKELLRIVGAKARLIRAAGQREGYFNVPYALAETGFDEVVVLDSDMTPLSSIDALLQDEEYLRHGALLASDFLDLRTRDFYPEAWDRLGLPAPVCPTDARCRRVWGTDSAVMALNIRRCAGSTAVLRALAADAAETQRYAWSGDKELYQIAWQAVGCAAAFLPYPSLLGQTSEHLGFAGLAMTHPDNNGQMLGVHWAWSKALLHHSVPKLSTTVSPPLGGYALPSEHQLNHAQEVAAGILAASGEVREHFYFLRLKTCFAEVGHETPCITTAADVDGRLSDFGALLTFARWALHDCGDDVPPGARCPLRLRLPSIARERAAYAFPWLSAWAKLR